MESLQFLAMKDKRHNLQTISVLNDSREHRRVIFTVLHEEPKSCSLFKQASVPGPPLGLSHPLCGRQIRIYPSEKLREATACWKVNPICQISPLVLIIEAFSVVKVRLQTTLYTGVVNEWRGGGGDFKHILYFFCNSGAQSWNKLIIAPCGTQCTCGLAFRLNYYSISFY